jgi:hypothetical protein
MDPHATNFDIKEIVIESISGKEIDVTLLMEEINFYEDIHNNCISADISIVDALNQINKIPLTGHEYIRLSWKTPHANDYVNVRLRIYKIDTRELVNERCQFYGIHCVDPIQFVNAYTMVSKAYNGKLISDIANDIQTNYLGSSFYQLEPTKNSQHLIVGNWYPFKAMNFLTSRANSTQYQGANYLYFQNINGFNFVSMEKLCDTKPKQTYIFQSTNIRKNIPEGYKPRTLKTDQVAIQSYKFENNFDTLDNITHGMYTNTLLWHDIQLKQFGETTFDYPSSYSKYIHIEPNTVKGGSSYLWTPKSDFNAGKFGEYKLYPIGLPTQENYVKQWLQPRISQLQQIQNVHLFVTIPGDSERRAGDIVKVSLPSPEPPIEDQMPLDEYFSDNYLVTAVRHMINKKQYLTVLDLVKDSVFHAY